MLKKCAIILLPILFFSGLWHFVFQRPDSTKHLIENTLLPNQSMVAPASDLKKAPAQTIREIDKKKKLEEDWYVAQVDWLIKKGKKVPEVQALSHWQNDLLDALDDHPENKKNIEATFNQKLEKILGKKEALEFLDFKKEYDEKIK